MIVISLTPELDHANAETVVWMGTGEEKTPVGAVRATVTCSVQVGEFYLSIDDARKLANIIGRAATAAKVWRDELGGYVVTRTTDGVFCKRKGVTGKMRRKRFRRRKHTCYRCRKPCESLWVPVHTPWNGSNEVAAELCDLCLNNCTVEAQRPLRVVDG